MLACDANSQLATNNTADPSRLMAVVVLVQLGSESTWNHMEILARDYVVNLVMVLVRNGSFYRVCWYAGAGPPPCSSRWSAAVCANYRTSSEKLLLKLVLLHQHTIDVGDPSEIA